MGGSVDLKRKSGRRVDQNTQTFAGGTQGNEHRREEEEKKPPTFVLKREDQPGLQVKMKWTGKKENEASPDMRRSPQEKVITGLRSDAQKS